VTDLTALEALTAAAVKAKADYDGEWPTTPEDKRRGVQSHGERF
jgi:hypothetical protein